MDRILDRLYLGDLGDGVKATAPITCIMNLHEQTYASALWVIHAPIPDEVFLYAPLWQELVHALAQHLTQGQTVLAHCRLGISRSPALVAAYLMSIGMQPMSALQYVQEKRPQINIHVATWQGIMAWWKDREHTRDGH